MISFFFPEYAVWETTLACNLNCRHCGSTAGAARSRELSSQEALGICDQLIDVGLLRVILSGGETLFRKDWPELVGALAHGGMQVGLITNGVALSESGFQQRYRRRWLELQADGVSFSLGISLDGLADANDWMRSRAGCFQEVLRAMAFVQDLGQPLSLLTTVTRKNLAQLPELYDSVLDRFTPYAWQFQTANNYGRMKEFPDMFLNREEYLYLVETMAELRSRRDACMVFPADCIGYYSREEARLRDEPWKGCQAGIRVIGIQSNGNLKGCLSLIDDCFVEGNLLQRHLKDLWYDERAFAYNRGFTVADLEGFCYDCPHGRVCRAGCRGVSHSFYGRMYKAPYCAHAFRNRGVAEPAGPDKQAKP